MVILESVNKTKTRISVNKIGSLLNLAERKLKLKTRQTISLAFVAPAEIRKLNKSYRHIDKVTDVLSFNSWFNEEEDDNIGEIIICVDQAMRQAKEYKQSLMKEIFKLALHGYLHLLGYDHGKRAQAVEMENLEEIILKSFYAECKKVVA